MEWEEPVVIELSKESEAVGECSPFGSSAGGSCNSGNGVAGPCLNGALATFCDFGGAP